MDYYVATDGDDSNPGTIDQPWRDVDRAVDQLGAGDTLYFRGGTYSQSFDVESFAAGTSESPITLSACPGEAAILDYSGMASGDPIWLKGQYVVFSGFQITGSSHYGLTITGQHVIVENCVLHDNANDQIKILTVGQKVDKLMELLEDGDRRLVANRAKTLGQFRSRLEKYHEHDMHFVTPATQESLNLQ